MELKGNYIIQRSIDGVNLFLEGFIKDSSLTYRTFGLKDNIGYELEYTLSLHPMEALRILDDVVPKFLKGFAIEDNKVTSELTGAPVMLLITEPRYKYYEDEKVLRIIFSDEDFKLPNQIGCDPNFAKQMQ